MLWIVRVIQTFLPRLMAGPMPAIAKGGFNMGMLAIGLIISGYFANVDKSIQFLTASVNRLNGNVSALVEQSESQKKIQEMHSRILENLDRRLQRLEEKTKGKL